MKSVQDYLSARKASRSGAALNSRANRRTFLQWSLGGASAFAAMPLLAACGVRQAPAASSAGSPGAAVPGPTPPVSSATGPYPTFAPNAAGPKPDFPALGDLYEDAFSRYPAHPSRALPASPPGLGGTITAMAPALLPPPTPFEQNPAWQEVNKQLNANFQFNIVPQADYLARLATIMAGGELPDLTFFQGGLTGVANLPQFLQRSAADLTPYLSGDAARDYPNLAAIPTYAWKNAGCVIDGHLYMVPLQRYIPGTILFKNEAIYDSEIGPGYVPRNADDFKRVLLQLNRPKEGRWATGSFNASNGTGIYNVVFYSAMFGAPNNWRLESDGKLTKDYETEEFKAAVAYVRDLVALDLYHPNSLQYPTNNAGRYDYQAGKMATYADGFGVVWNDVWRFGVNQNPPVNHLMIDPFPAADGGKPAHFFGTGYLGTEVIKKGSAEREMELLRILNWLAAPFGSQEDALLTLGIQGVDYNLDASGNPVLTERGNPDAFYVPWKYVMQHPQVIYAPDIPNYARTLHEAERTLIPLGVQNPTLGYFSPTLVAKGTLLTRAVADGLIEIMTGRRPFSDWDQVVRDWQLNGGNQMRTELQQAMQRAS
jgi:putative aldouronate transport system substrate-binding protein